MNPPPISAISVPRIDFNGFKMLSSLQGGGAGAFLWSGPSYAVDRIASSVAAQGRILPIQPPSLNASWDLTFNAPSIKCTDIDQTLRAQMLDNILLAFTYGTGCSAPYNFLSWTATADSTLLSGLPLQNFSNTPLPFRDVNSTDGRWAMNSGTLGPLDPAYYFWAPNYRINMTQGAMLYFAVIPDLRYTQAAGCRNDRLVLDPTLSTFVQCELRNTTYSAKFSYTNGEQNLRFSPLSGSVSTPVAAVNKMWVTSHNDSTCLQGWNFDNPQDTDPNCSTDPALLQRLSFQAVMDAFGKIFTGYVVDLWRIRAHKRDEDCASRHTRNGFLDAPGPMEYVNTRSKSGHD
jgi:hypothetical protein